MDEICSDFHNCHRCGGLTLCETFKQTCPWADSDIEREGLDGAMCATCMDEVMQALAKNMKKSIDLMDLHEDEEDGA